MEIILTVIVILWIGSIITTRRIGIVDIIGLPPLLYFIFK